MNLQYSVLIQWSDEDQAYLVIIPEFGPDAQAHGETYDEAIKNAQEVLELLIESYQERQWSLPQPAKYARAVPA